ncbi:hypothetical protein [Microbacterium allomyrinae]|uniref:Uncharacterized protein n=1 Tax=Microbacterium allomyrinae TaxID=2830666 RepID=A0A9X1LVZ7_9MICO|nr:hypothetical protein [Microbacterium allomyrinae]MCC2033085.1 hypothetical protein [Microbacterium allomyrinae]
MTTLEDPRAVREAGNRLGNPLARESMTAADVVAVADMLDRYAELLERLAAPPTDDEREALGRLLRELLTTDDEDPENGEPGWSLVAMRNQILAAGFRRQGPITDEMVDAAARAIFEVGHIDGDYTWAEMVREDPSRADIWRADARTALEAARDAS